MTAQIIDVVSKVADTLNSNITDPRNSRDQRFVFDHFPKYNKGLPRLGVTEADTSYQTVGINSGVTSVEDTDIIVHIVVHDGQDYTLPPYNGAKPSEYVISWLSRRVKEVVENNQSSFTSLDGVQYVQPHPEITSLPERTLDSNKVLRQQPFRTQIRP